jgi:hypothetical protein
VVCLLGTGGYGKVFLVRSRQDLKRCNDADYGKTGEAIDLRYIHAKQTM